MKIRHGQTSHPFFILPVNYVDDPNHGATWCHLYSHIEAYVMDTTCIEYTLFSKLDQQCILGKIYSSLHP